MQNSRISHNGGFKLSNFTRHPSRFPISLGSRRISSPKITNFTVKASVEQELQAVEQQAEPVVYGRVSHVESDGATVIFGDDLEGYLPGQEGPWTFDGSSKRHRLQEFISAGLKREFVVLDPAKGGGKSRRGQPIISARAVDKNLLWRRIEQMHELCLDSCENYKVNITGVNTGGLTCNLGGLPAFVPVSQIEKKPDGSWWTRDELEDKFLGQQASVAILDVSREENKLVCSIVRANENNRMRRLEVGALVEGVVRRIEPFGVFVGISGTRVSGLLHISNISRVRVDRPKDIFESGEKVFCVILGIDYDFSNISFSTAELEVEDGDMFSKKSEVWAKAEEQAAIFQQSLRDEAEQ